MTRIIFMMGYYTVVEWYSVGFQSVFNGQIGLNLTRKCIIVDTCMYGSIFQV